MEGGDACDESGIRTHALSDYGIMNYDVIKETLT